jgi:hypothetical protein
MSLSRATADAIARIGGDPTDLLWEWIASYGPHGAHFTWAQTKREPPGYVGVEHLEQVISEKEMASPGHRNELRDRARLGLASSDDGLLRRCIQISSVVGGNDELETLIGLIEMDGVIGSDARAAAFYLRRRLKRDAGNASPPVN